jgi:hypothetical protein
MTHLTETRERFFRAIAKEIPVDQIAEIHFFQPVRQGGVESGVAVVAAIRTTADGRPTTDEEQPIGDEEPERAIERFTVYAARYRHTLKGPDRGKWETSVVPEADAPLVTVDAVVRGVQRRSGDVDEVDRITGDEARELAETLARAPSPAGSSFRA